MFKKQLIIMYSIAIVCMAIICKAQVYDDHYGIGNNVQMSVSGSKPQSGADAFSTVTGTGYFPDLAGSARFLSQATLGYNWQQISYVANTGINNWLDEQFAITPGSYYSKYNSIYNHALGITQNSSDLNEYLSFTFYEMVLKEPDVLRQKVAFALSQILVLSLPAHSRGVASYYDVLYKNAFGNYGDILNEITLHPAMALYLNSYKNKKADFALNTFPDENYARELMQLFTIGLWQLNNDGSLKLNSNGNPIKTYDIGDVEQLAKVFTGLGAGDTNNHFPPNFLISTLYLDFNTPLAMYEAYHDKSTKQLIDGTVLAYNQAGKDDISNAVNALFNHPNVGPFLSTRLIQHLVKSNPSPQYINRVAKAFNNNGNGVRGDLTAVLKAIFLDPEARDCSYIDHTTSGKLIQPIERMLNLYKAFDVSTPSNKFYLYDLHEFKNATEQSFLNAPTVFNFFTPFFSENIFVKPANLVSPEFEILNTYTATAYINLIEDALKKKPFANLTSVNTTYQKLTENINDEPTFDFTAELALLANSGITALIERLDILLCRGQLSFSNKTIIENTLNQNFASVTGYANEDAVKDAIYYIMISPNYTILK